MLWRTWDEDKGHVLFIGLNPSVANENIDDPTIRREVGFAKAWGFGGLYKLNLFALIATDPRELVRAHDAGVGQAAYDSVVGLENNEFLEMYSGCSDLTVAAWGERGVYLNRCWDVVGSLPQEVMCLGLNKSGQPKHPLYLPKTAVLMRWPGATSQERPDGQQRRTRKPSPLVSAVEPGTPVLSP